MEIIIKQGDVCALPLFGTFTCGCLLLPAYAEKVPGISLFFSSPSASQIIQMFPTLTTLEKLVLFSSLFLCW